MANQEHLEPLKEGVEAWNQWRQDHPDVEPDLMGADLRRAKLNRANLRRAKLNRADLSEANLMGAYLGSANLQEANLSKARFSMRDPSEGSARALLSADLGHANLQRANLIFADLEYVQLRWAQLRGAQLQGAHLRAADLSIANLEEAHLAMANLEKANLSYANLNGAILAGANLSRAILVETKLDRANLRGCSVYGMAAWNVQGELEDQSDLLITRGDEAEVRVDDLEVAQFVYLLLNNQKIHNVLDTIGAKGVLILGRFTEERKAVLDAIRGRLRELGFVPMMFDFERAKKRDFTETIKTLAGLSRFIIADITNPRSSPLELQATMPDYMIPFVPIIHEDEEPFEMFRDLQQKYSDWVLDVRKYDSVANLQERLEKAVVRPALDKSKQLILKKTEEIRTRHINEYQ
jgi:uncharacterized protein YjbI with pentapeptide repeats